jgi:hypothetical protein
VTFDCNKGNALKHKIHTQGSIVKNNFNFDYIIDDNILIVLCNNQPVTTVNDDFAIKTGYRNKEHYYHTIFENDYSNVSNKDMSKKINTYKDQS